MPKSPMMTWMRQALSAETLMKVGTCQVFQFIKTNNTNLFFRNKTALCQVPLVDKVRFFVFVEEGYHRFYDLLCTCDCGSPDYG